MNWLALWAAVASVAVFVLAYLLGRARTNFEALKEINEENVEDLGTLYALTAIAIGKSEGDTKSRRKILAWLKPRLTSSGWGVLQRVLTEHVERKVDGI